MSKPVKILTLALWIVAVAGMVSVVAMQLSNRGVPQIGSPIVAPDFVLTDQLGRTFSSQDLKGHPWIADFFFTECTSECPLMTKHLSDLQKSIPPEVKFVSFSVDPNNDTPPALLAYAKQYSADNDRWRFLTGEKTQVAAAIAGMKVSIIPATAANQIGHDIHFLLMDSDGRLHNVYDSRDPAEMSRLVADAGALAAEGKP